MLSCFHLNAAQLMKGQYVDPFHITEAGSETGNLSDVLQVVRQPRHQHVAQPNRLSTA